MQRTKHEWIIDCSSKQCLLQHIQVYSS